MIDETLNIRPGRPKDTAKRDEIVAAATDLFMQNGYELTSMEAVARQAGVSKLTIYSHFADKKELFRAIAQRRCEKLGMSTSFEEEAKMPVRQALLHIATVSSAKIFREDSIRLMRMLHGEAVRHPEMAAIYYETGPTRVKQSFADLLRTFDARGQVSIPDPIIATEQFFSLLKGERLTRVLLLQSPAPTIEDMERHAAGTVDFFLKAYQCPPAQSNQKPAETEKP